MSLRISTKGPSQGAPRISQGGYQMSLQTAREFSLTRTAMKAELLDAETELELAYAWRDHRDEAALHRLITAYMRLAISMRL